MHPDDATAVAQALAGRRAGYRVLFDAHVGMVERLVRSFPDVADSHVAPLADEILATALARLPALRQPARFVEWVMALTRQRMLARKGAAEGSPIDAEPAGLVPDDLPRADQLVLARELAQWLRSAAPEPARAFYLMGLPPPGPQSPGAAEFQIALARTRGHVKALLAAELLLRRFSPVHQGAPEHLDAAACTRLASGDRLPGEAALAEHLRTGCARCEEAFAGAAGVDGLDGMADALLLSGAPQPTSAGPLRLEKVLRLMRVQARLFGRASTAPVSGPSRAVPLAIAGVLALAGALAMAVGFEPSRTAAQPDVSLAFRVAAHGGDQAVPGTPGQRCQPDDALVLDIQLAAAAFVSVVHVPPEGEPEVLSQLGRLTPGGHGLSVNGAAARVSLAGAPGEHRLGALASSSPLTPEQLDEALHAVAASAPEQLPPHAAADWFDVVVEPGG